MIRKFTRGDNLNDEKSVYREMMESGITSFYCKYYKVDHNFSLMIDKKVTLSKDRVP